MKLKSGSDRFDLEQAIMVAWGTTEDIKLVWEYYYDGKEPMTPDELANVLLGLQNLHHLRCQKMWDIFEQLIREKKL